MWSEYLHFGTNGYCLFSYIPDAFMTTTETRSEPPMFFLHPRWYLGIQGKKTEVGQLGNETQGSWPWWSPNTSPSLPTSWIKVPEEAFTKWFMVLKTITLKGADLSKCIFPVTSHCLYSVLSVLLLCLSHSSSKKYCTLTSILNNIWIIDEWCQLIWNIEHTRLKDNIIYTRFWTMLRAITCLKMVCSKLHSHIAQPN